VVGSFAIRLRFVRVIIGDIFYRKIHAKISRRRTASFIVAESTNTCLSASKYHSGRTPSKFAALYRAYLRRMARESETRKMALLM